MEFETERRIPGQRSEVCFQQYARVSGHPATARYIGATDRAMAWWDLGPQKVYRYGSRRKHEENCDDAEH